MSIFSAIFNRSVASYEEAFQASDITSEQMRTAISEWFDLYFQKAATEQEDPCQQIPYTIVHKLTKTAFSEYTATGKDDFVQMVLAALDQKRKKAMQMSLIGGESYIKPIPSTDGFRFGVINRLNMMVFGRDNEGNATDIGTFEHSVRNTNYYSLLERRTVDARGYLKNHRTRSIPSPTIDEQTAIASAAQKLDVHAARLCIIPQNRKEYLCYEISAADGEDRFLVYIDAKTGVQRDLMQLIPMENGTLVM